MFPILNGDTVKAETSEVLQACRICLCWDEKLYSIHEWGLIEMYGLLSGTTPSPWDGLPQHLCAWCRAQLARAHALRARCRSADLLLKQALMQRHCITNSYIRSIDRSTHKLTHTLSTQRFDSDSIYYFNYDTCNELFIENNGHFNDIADDNEEVKFDLNDDGINNYIENDDNSDLVLDKYKHMQDVNNEFKDNTGNLDAKINIAEVEISKNVDLQIKKAKSKTKRLITTKNEKGNKVREKPTEIKILETPIENEIEIVNKKTQTKKRSKQKEMDKVRNTGNLDAKINIAEVEISKNVDLQIKKVKSKTKRLITTKNEKGNKVREKPTEIKILETPIENEIEIDKVNKKTQTKKGSKQKEMDKVRETKDKFCTEEDFKEFEKKYQFEVQCLTEEEMEKEMEKRKESDKYLKGEYKCESCYKGFFTSVTYENHMKAHDVARGAHACRLCGARYQFPAKLRLHVQSAHRLKFRCTRCNESVRGRTCAVLHAAYHAGTTFQCAHCDKQFLKKTSRASHMRMAHPVENAAGGTCELCGETFTSRTGLKAHKTRSHKKTISPEFRCRKCRIQFDNMEALKRHKETHADNKCDPSLSACEQCGETCAGADDLIRHRHAQHAVELFTCDTCTKSFTSKASLSTHIDRIHRRIRPPKAYFSDGGRRTQPDWLHWASVCELCGKRLSCLSTLKIHMNKHTGERPYKCSLCPKTYMTPYGLNNHQAFHTGVRKWQCPECPATFMHQSSVYQHRKIHTGERPHQCTICYKYFTQSGSLYTHVKYVHMKETPPPRKRNKKAAQQ